MTLVGTKGGSGVWQRIISEMPPHDVYVEAFWGRGTIARRKRPAPITIGVDRDLDAISDGRVLATMFRGCGIEWLKGYFRLVPDRDEYRVAAGGAADLGVTADGYATYGGYPWDRHFVYLDPPYVGCQGRGYYRHEPTDDEHRDLCRVFKALPCPAALSGYWSDVYAAELRDSRSISYQTVNRSGRTVREYLWCNFDEPDRLHDARFVGSGRRERERIRRRVKTWSDGLRSMPPAERQAVWDACQGVVGEQAPIAR